MRNGFLGSFVDSRAEVKAREKGGVPERPRALCAARHLVVPLPRFHDACRARKYSRCAPARALVRKRGKGEFRGRFSLFFFAGRLLEKSWAFTILLIARFATHYANFVRFSLLLPWFHRVAFCRRRGPRREKASCGENRIRIWMFFVETSRRRRAPSRARRRARDAFAGAPEGFLLYDLAFGRGSASRAAVLARCVAGGGKRRENRARVEIPLKS